MVGRQPTAANGADATTIKAVLDASPGEAFGVRATAEFGDTILSGIVAEVLPVDPESDLPALGEVVDDEDLPAGAMDSIGLALDARTWWILPPDGAGEDPVAADSSERLHDRPPARPYLGEPEREPPRPTIGTCLDGSLGLTIPGRVYGGGRLKYYAPDDHGRVIAFDSGALITSRSFLTPQERLPKG